MRKITKNWNLGKIRIEITINSLKKHVNLIQKINNILDLGVGPNVLWYNMIENVNTKSTVGVDISMGHLKSAKKSYPNIYFIQSDGCFLPFKLNVFDLVFLFEVLEHLPKNDRLVLLQQILYSINKNGLLLLTTPLRDTFISLLLKIITAIPKTHLYEHNLRELKILSKKTSFQLIDYKVMMLYHLYKIIPKITFKGLLSRILGRAIILFLKK